MKRFVSILVILLMTVTLLPAVPAAYVWREFSAEISRPSINNPRTTDGIEVFSKPGGLIVRTPVRASVRVLTILGQTVSQVVINPGTYELNLNTHGIFIVKVGDYTLRVAI